MELLEGIQEKLEDFKLESQELSKITKEYDDYKKMLENKMRKGQEPTKEELKQYVFIKNNLKHKLAIKLDCMQTDIALSTRDFSLMKRPMYVYGNVNVTEAKPHLFDEIIIHDPKKLKNVKKIFGNLLYEFPRDTEHLSNLEEVNGDIHIVRATSLTGLKQLRICRGDFILEHTKFLDGLDHLEEIWGSFITSNITNEAGIKNLRFVLEDWKANFTSAKLPTLELIGGDAWFPEIKNQHALPGLKYIGGDAHFEEACSRGTLQNLELIVGDAYFDNMAREDAFPKLTKENVGGTMHLPRAQEEGIEELLERFELESKKKPNRSIR